MRRACRSCFTGPSIFSLALLPPLPLSPRRLVAKLSRTRLLVGFTESRRDGHAISEAGAAFAMQLPSDSCLQTKSRTIASFRSFRRTVP